MDLSTSTPDARFTRGESWQERLAGAPPAAACTAWLQQFAVAQPACRRALVLLRTPANELRLTAVTPAGAVAQDLLPLLTAAAAVPAPQRLPGAGGWLLTQPLLAQGELRGMVAAEFAAGDALDAAADSLAWGAGWLLACTGASSAGQQEPALQEARVLLQSMAALLAERGFEGACLALAHRLCLRWHADAVLVGWTTGLRTRIVARSNASRTDERSGLAQLAAAAMDEALDLRQSVQCQLGNPAASPVGRLHAHEQLLREAGCNTAATALLFHDGAAVGAVLVQRSTPLSPEEQEVLDTQCMMLAPLLVQRHQSDRSLWQHARASARQALGRVGDDSLLGWKLGFVAVAVLIGVAAVTPIPFRVTAPAVVEGEVQRSIVAPFQGFVQHAMLRAGDTVRAGDVIATLDDTDLRLEAQKWSAELEVAQRKEREAVAEGKRVDMRLAAAQAAQARAQLDLAQEKLRRVKLVAPFDGVIVRGDLSQQRGIPVEQGKVLFEVAPLASWRLILKIDERDVAQVDAGRKGELALAGLAGERHPFEVRRVTSIATAENGANHFRAEAELGEGSVKLRPGMEGVAKIDCGTASALWVGTRRLVAWLRLTAWEWAP
jgi:RND family efflux transporter MFP subunit